jgi:hypothetical protein
MADMLLKRRKDSGMREAGHEKMKVETGVMLPHAKKCLWLPGTGRTRRYSPPQISKGFWPSQYPEFQVWPPKL